MKEEGGEAEMEAMEEREKEDEKEAGGGKS